MQLQVTPGGFAKCFAFCKTFRCTKSLKGLRTAKPPGDVTEARRDFVTSFCRFAMGGIFTTELYAEHQTFSYHKTVCGARNPAYCKCAVISRFYSSHLSMSSNLLSDNICLNSVLVKLSTSL